MSEITDYDSATFTHTSDKLIERANDYFENHRKPIIITNIEDQLPFIAEKLDELDRTDQSSEALQVVRQVGKLINRLHKIAVKLYPLNDEPSFVRGKVRAFTYSHYEGELSKVWTEIEDLKADLMVYLKDHHSHVSQTEQSIVTLVEAPTSKTYHYPSNLMKYFVKRSSILDSMDKTLGSKSKVVSLVGYGGSGKTQLALQYCKQSEDNNRYSSIFWINASSTESVYQSCSIIAHAMDPSINLKDSSGCINLVKHHLKSWTDSWLIVFDNVNPQLLEDDIQEYFPEGDNGSILLTSRYGTHNFGSTISTNEMSQREALDLFTHYAGYCKDGIPTVISLLKHLPLAIHQAATYIGLRKPPLEKFIKEYNDKRQVILTQTPRLNDYRANLNDAESEASLSVFVTWELLFSQLDNTKQEGISQGKLLLISSFFETYSILEDFFKLYFEYDYPKWMEPFTAHGTWNTENFQRIISNLTDLSLISSFEVVNDRLSFSLHSLVQDWIKLKSDQGLYHALKDALLMLSNYTSHQHLSKLTWNLKQTILMHISMCLQNEKNIDPGGTESNDPQMLIATRTFASLYNDVGQIEKAEYLYDQALIGFKKTLGEDSPSTLRTLYTLGSLYLKSNQLERAEELLQDATEGYSRVFGNDHVWTLAAVHRLGDCHRAQGEWSKSEELHQRALRGFEIHIGAEDPATLAILAEQALLYHTKREFANAETMYERVLKGYKRELGEADPKTLEAAQNLASLYRDNGELDKAEVMYKQVLEGRTEIMGEKDISTLKTLCYLACVYGKKKQWNEGEQMYKKAISGFEQSLGPNNKTTLLVVNHLANFNCNRGRPEEAVPLYLRVLAGHEKIEGVDSLTTLGTVHSLGVCYHSQQKWDKAEAMYERAMKGRLKLLGADNPSTIQSIKCLASLYKENHRSGKAWTLLKRYHC